MWCPRIPHQIKNLEMLHVSFFRRGRGLVFVFAYFCRGSNMKNQTEINNEEYCQRSTHM